MSNSKLRCDATNGLQQLLEHWQDGARAIIAFVIDMKAYAAVSATCRILHRACESEAQSFFLGIGLREYPVLALQKEYVNDFRLACKRLKNLESPLHCPEPRLVPRKWTDYCGHTTKDNLVAIIEEKFAFVVTFRQKKDTSLKNFQTLASMSAKPISRSIAGHGSPHTLALTGRIEPSLLTEVDTSKTTCKNFVSALTASIDEPLTVSLHILEKANGAQALLQMGLFVLHQNKLHDHGYLSAGFATELSVPEQALGADLPRPGSFILVSQATMNLVVEKHTNISFHIHFDIGLGPHWNSLSPQGVAFMLEHDLFFV